MADSRGCTWRSTIIERLQKRNVKESKSYDELITFHNRLFQSVDIIKVENIQLKLQKERLQQENIDLQCRAESGDGKPSQVTAGLEKKLFQLQEELTELHRTKGENAQKLIDVKIAFEEKERELSSKTMRLTDTEAALSAMRTACQNLEQAILDKETSNQILRDEHEALQLAFSSLQEKHNQLQREYQDLVTRWMAFKARDADRLNAENERMLRFGFLSKLVWRTRSSSWPSQSGRLRDLLRLGDELTRTLKQDPQRTKPGVAFEVACQPLKRVKQAQLQRELEEAAREPMPVNEKPESLKYVPICITASLPSKPTVKFDAHEGDVNAVKWSPSGNLVATGGGDRKVKLWEIMHGQYLLKGTLTGNNAAVMCVDFDPDESVVLCASNDFASRVWTISDSRLRHTLTGHCGKVMAAKFLGEPSKVASGSHDRTLKLWDLRSRACIRTIFAGSSCNDLVTSDSAGTNIISGHFDKRIRFWDTRSESSANEILLQGKITSLDLSPDGYYLLSCVRDDTLKLLDLRMNQVMRTFCSEGFKVGCDWTRAKFSPDGSYIVVGSQDGAIFIWNASNGKVEKINREHNAVVTACAWNSRGNYIVSCDRNKKVILWSEF